MSWIYVLSGVLATVLLIYLLWALLRAEEL